MFCRHVTLSLLLIIKINTKYGQETEGMQRMLVIINKLKGPQQYVPRKELENYVTHRMEERDGTPVDIRTLQRDFKDIEDLFGIRICFDKKQNGYYINEEDDLKRSSTNGFC